MPGKDKKIELPAYNPFSGSRITIETPMKKLGREALRDMIFYETKLNKNTKNVLSNILHELKQGADELDREIEDIRRFLRGRK